MINVGVVGWGMMGRTHLSVHAALFGVRMAAIAEADAAARAKSGVLAMPAMCIRFWPGWTWLKRAIEERRFGRVLAARFQRLASHPGGAFYSNADASGAAALDLHIHDTDFVRFCF